VWSCVRIISSVIAQFPLPIYRRSPDGKKERLDQHPLYRILNRRPNERMTAFHFRQTLMAHLLTWGNAYAFVDRDNAGRVKSLWPLMPDRTFPKLDESGQLVYVTRIKTDPNGMSPSDAKQIVLQPEDVLHIPGLGFDGLKGYSVISQMREDIGLGLAMTEYAARFFGNGAVPGFVLQTENNLSPEQKTMLKTAWQEGHQGLVNANRVAILERGLKVEKISIPPEDAQFLESRQFSKEEIAEIFGVPGHLLGAMDKTTGAWSGLEQLSLQFLQYTINPILENWQQSIDVRLFSEDEQANLFVEFITADLLRSDIAARGAYYDKAVGKWLTANDIRRMENQAPWYEEEGEVKFLPPGAVPLQIALHPPEPVAPAAPAADPAPDARFVEPLLRNLLERTLKRERVDIVKTKRYDGSDVGTFLDAGLAPIVESLAISGVDAKGWAENIARGHVGESVRLLGAGDEVGIEAAFGTATNRVARETQAALAAIRTTAPASTVGIVMEGMFRALTELAGRRTEPTVVNNNITTPPVTVTPTFTMPEQNITIPPAQIRVEAPITVQPQAIEVKMPPILVTPNFVMPEQPITIQPAEVRVEAAVVNVQPPNVEVKLDPIINVAAPDAVATEVVYHTKGPLKGAVKGQRPVKELKD
jgi:HK97 family phage portal protein